MANSPIENLASPKESFRDWTDAELLSRINTYDRAITAARRNVERWAEHKLDCISAARAELTRRLVVFVPETSSWVLDEDRADELLVDDEGAALVREAKALIAKPEIFGAGQ